MLDIVPSQTTPRFAFGPDDAVHIDGVAYRAIQKTEDGWIFVRVDGTGVAEACTHTELARHAQLGAIRHVRDGLLPEGARQRLAAPAELLSTLSAEQHREVRIREPPFWRSSTASGRAGSSARMPPSRPPSRTSRSARAGISHSPAAGRRTA